MKPVIPPKPKKMSSSSSLSPRSKVNNSNNSGSSNNSSFDDNLELEAADPQIYKSREMLRRIQSKSVSFCSINDNAYDK